MSTADKDGRVAQILNDLHTTTSMAMFEHARAAAAAFDREMAKVQAVVESSGTNLDGLRRVAQMVSETGCTLGEAVRAITREAQQ